jgi:HYR domain
MSRQIQPDNITVEVTGPNGTPVEYAVTAEDNVDGTAILEQDGSIIRQDDVGGSIAISCNPPSGFEFPIGNTAVECTATDASGNEGEGFFTITVQEAVVGPQPTIDPLTVETISNGTESVAPAPATFDFEASVIGSMFGTG